MGCTDCRSNVLRYQGTSRRAAGLHALARPAASPAHGQARNDRRPPLILDSAVETESTASPDIDLFFAITSSLPIDCPIFPQSYLRMNCKLVRILRLLASLSVSAVLLHAASEPLGVHLSVDKVVVSADGKTSYTPTETANPGDMIRYAAVYQNDGHQTLGNVAAVIPIPEGTVLVDNSAIPAAFEYSYDGKEFAEFPEDPKAPAPENERIRSLRWKGTDLAPGAKLTVELRVRVKQ